MSAFVISITFALASFLVIPLVVLPLVLTGRRVRRLSRDAQDTLARSAGLAQEALSAVPTIQAYGQTERVREAFAAATEQAFAAAGWRTAMRAWLTAAIIFIAFGSVVGVLWYGAQSVLAGEMSGGTLGQFVLYAVLAATGLASNYRVNDTPISSTLRVFKNGVIDPVQFQRKEQKVQVGGGQPDDAAFAEDLVLERVDLKRADREGHRRDVIGRGTATRVTASKRR